MLFDNPGAEQILDRLPAWIAMYPLNFTHLSSLAIAAIAVDVEVGSLMSGKVIWRAARVDVVVRPLLRH